jgi:hypothetical protein
MNPPIDRQGDLNLDECRVLDNLTRCEGATRVHSTNVVVHAAIANIRTGRKFMAAMSRRAMLTNVLPGAVVAVAGVGAIGWAVAPEVADAMPLAIAKGNHFKVDDLVEEAQVVIVNPRRRRRRWVCWWHRGRRRCGWRW